MNAILLNGCFGSYFFWSCDGGKRVFLYSFLKMWVDMGRQRFCGRQIRSVELIMDVHVVFGSWGIALVMLDAC